MTQLPIYTDRSKIEARWECPRRAYWQYYDQGHGWQRQPGIDLMLGTMVHNAIEETQDSSFIPGTVPSLTESMLAGFQQWTPEQAYRILIFATEVVRATYRSSQAWKNIEDANGKLCQAELEFKAFLSGGVYQARPDLLFKLPDGRFSIVNIKTSSGTAEWQKWGIQPAIVGEFWALKQLDFDLAASWVFHVNKGKRMNPKGGMTYFSSPLFIGYKKGDVLSLEYKAGWERVWLWEVISPNQWVEKLKNEHPNVLNSIYEVSGPHLPDANMLESWKEAINREINSSHQDGELAAFPQHFGRSCLWPNQCGAFDFCWGMASLDPPSMGFEARQPNHPTEEP